MTRVGSEEPARCSIALALEGSLYFGCGFFLLFGQHAVCIDGRHWRARWSISMLGDRSEMSTRHVKIRKGIDRRCHIPVLADNNRNFLLEPCAVFVELEMFEVQRPKISSMLMNYTDVS